MRVLLAALFVFAVMLLSVGYVPERLMPWGMIVVMLLAMFVAFVLFDKHFIRRLLISHEKDIEKQLAKGLAAKETYKVARSLTFEDLRTGCVAHFLDVSNGSVMVLYGQYLYEYEPIEDDPEMNQPRRFPTTEFTVVRSLKNDELLDLVPGSNVIETGIVQEPGDYRVIADLGFKLKDGEINNDVTFDDVQAALAAHMKQKPT